MKLLEHQGKEILVAHGVPVPRSVLVASLAEFDLHKDKVPVPCVVKAQVHAGGRGKAGGIQPAESLEEARAKLRQVLGMRIKDETTRSALLEERLAVGKEMYAAVLVDRSSREGLLMVSAEGGVDIESVAPDRIHRATVNPLSGFQPYHARVLTARLGLDASATRQVAEVLRRLHDAFRGADAELVEVNPLVLTRDGRVVAADAKVILNDAALFRHPEYEGEDAELTPLEREARRERIAFVQLPGRIGVIANGAGLTMATLDALGEFGGEGGVFLDLGGTDDPEQVKRALRLMKKAHPAVVLVNLFGGITKCDTVARGLKAVLDEEGFPVAVIARIKGTNEELAREILKDAGLLTAASLRDAARLAVETERQAVARTR